MLKVLLLIKVVGFICGKRLLSINNFRQARFCWHTLIAKLLRLQFVVKCTRNKLLLLVLRMNLLGILWILRRLLRVKLLLLIWIYLALYRLSS